MPATKPLDATSRGTARRLMIRDIVSCCFIASIEAVLVRAYVMGLAPMVIVLFAHGLITAGLAVALDRRERSGQDARLLAIALVATGVSGVLGATMSVLLGLRMLLTRGNSLHLARWYERISGHIKADDVLDLHEQIRSGRTQDPLIDSTARFSAILRLGPLEEKQRVLSVIAQKYHPEFHRVLQIALRSPDAPIRVQGAAIVARLRSEERLKLKAIVANVHAEARDAATGLAWIGAIEDRIHSGLLDDQDVAAAHDVIEALARAALNDEPGNETATLAIARVWSHNGAYDEAAAALAPLVERGVEAAIEPLRLSLLQLGRLREFAAMTRLAQHHVAHRSRQAALAGVAVVPELDNNYAGPDHAGKAA